MAEIGHSTLKKKKPLALVDAAWEDVCTAIMQEQEHTAFLEGRARSSGRGPTATKLGECAKRDQMMRSKEYQQSFREGRTPIVEEGGNFIPSKRAKHRLAEQIGDDVQGRDVPPQPTGSGQGNGNTPRRPLAPINIFNRENPPLLCFLAGHNIKQCYGCKNKFGTGMQTPPNDMIIKLQVIRERLVNNNWIPRWKKSWGYFHLNINCLKLEKTILEVEDIYIPNDTRVNLKPAHVKKLEAMGWWQRVKMRA